MPATVHAFSSSRFFLCLLFVRSYDAVQRRVDELWVYVGEAGELALVDVGDNQLVRGGQYGLRAGEELVEVFCPFAALKDTNRNKLSKLCQAHKPSFS